MNEAAGNTRDEQLVGDHELDDRVELLLPRLKHGIKLLSLRDRPREPVEDETET